MYFSPLLIAEKYNYLSDDFTAAYKWLRETNLEKLTVGAYPIVEDRVIANVQEYTTFPAETAYFETHNQFFDIQYMISGKEMFGVCKRQGLVQREANSANDIVFYEEPELSGEILLLPGDLVIVAPEDAHKPRCIAGEACAVRKIVIKVKV